MSFLVEAVRCPHPRPLPNHVLPRRIPGRPHQPPPSLFYCCQNLPSNPSPSAFLPILGVFNIHVVSQAQPLTVHSLISRFHDLHLHASHSLLGQGPGIRPSLGISQMLLPSHCLSCSQAPLLHLLLQGPVNTSLSSSWSGKVRAMAGLQASGSWVLGPAGARQQTDHTGPWPLTLACSRAT